MTNKEIILLDLLRCNIVGGTDTTVSHSKLDWLSIYPIALCQGISAILLDAIGLLPSEMRPPKPMLLQWIGQATMMERMYTKHREKIASLADFYKLHDIRMLLLKGYGCSLGYPKPEHRPTGDIDVYLFGKQEEADALVEKRLGIKVHRDYHKHSTFNYGGVEVENHAKFIDDVSHKSNIRFERILMSVLEKYECEPSGIDNVLIPSPTFNALFLLRHTGEHFASNEITLRHVLDVGTFFQRYHSKIDWALVLKVYKEERMLRFFNAIATICVEYLGIESACFASDDKQYSYKSDTTLADRILSDIFEKKDVLPMTTAGIDTIGKKLKYAIDKSRRWWHNRWKYQLVYNENLAESFWWLARNRIR
ncbi:nucleotidyltransferase family protein [uncultured Prevotella sp.]|uniref:nucleotidyltransferase domain-containing protein n=1 Tax=uncultured Prevotella sp. TaxID=159272 RepID=UPI00260D2D0C|nr:nucleotidyltransferase family protein [uncultured Prevotella sp.]